MLGVSWENMGDRFSTSSKLVKPDLAFIPGVKQNASGWRIPHNCRKVINPNYKRRCASDVDLLSGLLSLEKSGVIVDHKELFDYMLEHQREGVRSHMLHRSGHIWDDPGAAKSLQGLVLLLLAGPPYLIVTLRSLRPSWLTRVERFTNLKFVSLSGRQEHKIDPSKKEVYFCHKEILQYWEDSLGQHKWSMLIDETHTFRDSKRSSHAAGKFIPARGQAATAQRLSQRARFRYSLTGTPYGSSAALVWSQLDIIDPWSWGSAFDFKQRYCKQREEKLNNGKVITQYYGVRRARELKARFQSCSIRRQIKDVMDMPSLRVQFPCLSDNEIDRGFGRGNKKDRKEATQGGSLYQYMLMLCASQKRSWTAAEVGLRLAQGQKVLVLTGRRVDVDRLEVAIRKEVSKRNLNCLVDGFSGDNSSAEDREKARIIHRDFKGASCYIGTDATIGIGLDFQFCSVAIFNMFPTNPNRLRQLMARLVRIGFEGDNIELVLPYIRGTIEEANFTKLFRRISYSRQLTVDEFLNGVEAEFEKQGGQESFLSAFI